MHIDRRHRGNLDPISLSIPTIAQRSSRHQNREARLIQGRPCDPPNNHRLSCDLLVMASSQATTARVVVWWGHTDGPVSGGSRF